MSVGMNLKEYLYLERMTLVAMAEKLFVHPYTLGAISRGQRKPSIHLAKHIEQITGGKVTAAEIMGQESTKKKPKKKAKKKALKPTGRKAQEP